MEVHACDATLRQDYQLELRILWKGRLPKIQLGHDRDVSEEEEQNNYDDYEDCDDAASPVQQTTISICRSKLRNERH